MGEHMRALQVQAAGLQGKEGAGPLWRRTHQQGIRLVTELRCERD
jgi:hypothetical protein